LRVWARASFSYLGKQEAALAQGNELEAQSGSVHCVQGDLADDGFAARFLAATTEKWGTPDCLVNNAGITGRYGRFAELPEEVLRRTFEAHCRKDSPAARGATPGDRQCRCVAPLR
jgi:NAD(P)-dependent dehydrogenase (short-subunit alcohol dehydrogenase family)